MGFLIDPSNYDGDILIVGDGNFTFSLSLVESLYNSGNRSHVVSTSFDSRQLLLSDELAANCLLKLEQFTNIEIIHNVDATKLRETFHERTFTRIIFNFPHCGGKSNISKSRTLLEKFFASAKEVIVPYEGEIYVTLCNGQGGTPADSPQREYGNTWQVVRQAAKAGLLLNKVQKFLASDYPQYQNAGFRGKLKRSFFSYKDGVTHIFTTSTKLNDIPSMSEFQSDDIQGKVEKFLEKQLQRKLLERQNHPICTLRQLMEKRFRTLQPDVVAISNKPVAVGKVSFCKNRIQEKVMEYLRGNTRAFIVSGHIIQPGCSVSCQSYLVQHKMVYVELQRKSDSGEALVMKMVNFLKAFLGKDLNIDLCCQEEEKPREGAVVKNELSDSCTAASSEITSTITVKKCSCSQSSKQCACGETDIEPVSEGVHVSASREHFWDESVERPYSSSSPILSSMKTSPLLIQSFQPCKIYWFGNKKANLDIATCSVIPKDLLIRCGQDDDMETVIVSINLDHLAMLCYNIPDIRWLWTEDHRFLQQFEKENLLDTPPVRFIPHCLYPDTFIHDICFWVQEGTSEELFFALVHVVTQACVKEVRFLHRYVDLATKAISYCYRMEYQRCDGAFTKEDSVILQNLLRQILMLLNFGLK